MNTTTGYSLIISLLISGYSLNLRAEDKLAKCDNALNACIELSRVQDNTIDLLKTQVTELEQRLADSQLSPILPKWLEIAAYLSIGAAIGVTILK